MVGSSSWVARATRRSSHGRGLGPLRAGVRDSRADGQVRSPGRSLRPRQLVPSPPPGCGSASASPCPGVEATGRSGTPPGATFQCSASGSGLGRPAVIGPGMMASVPKTPETGMNRAPLPWRSSSVGSPVFSFGMQASSICDVGCQGPFDPPLSGVCDRTPAGDADRGAAASAGQDARGHSTPFTSTWTISCRSDARPPSRRAARHAAAWPTATPAHASASVRPGRRRINARGRRRSSHGRSVAARPRDAPNTSTTPVAPTPQDRAVIRLSTPVAAMIPRTPM